MMVVLLCCTYFWWECFWFVRHLRFVGVYWLRWIALSCCCLLYRLSLIGFAGYKLRCVCGLVVCGYFELVVGRF